MASASEHVEGAQSKKLSGAQALISLHTPVVEPEPQQRPCRMSNSAFVNGLYCEYQEVKPDGRFLQGRIEYIQAGASSKVTLTPSEINFLSPTPPVEIETVMVPKSYVKFPIYMPGDHVHVLDDRPEIPDRKEGNQYWWDGEIIQVINRRRQLPLFVVKPRIADDSETPRHDDAIPAEPSPCVVKPVGETTVTATMIRHARYWPRHEFWSRGPDGPTNSEEKVLKSDKEESAKKDKKLQQEKEKALAKGHDLGDLMHPKEKHKLMSSQSTPTKTRPEKTVVTPGTPGMPEKIVEPEEGWAKTVADIIMHKGSDGEDIAMHKSQVGLVNLRYEDETKKDTVPYIRIHKSLVPGTPPMCATHVRHPCAPPICATYLRHLIVSPICATHLRHSFAPLIFDQSKPLIHKYGYRSYFHNLRHHLRHPFAPLLCATHLRHPCTRDRSARSRLFGFCRKS